MPGRRPVNPRRYRPLEVFAPPKAGQPRSLAGKNSLRYCNDDEKHDLVFVRSDRLLLRGWLWRGSRLREGCTDGLREIDAGDCGREGETGLVSQDQCPKSRTPRYEII